MNSIRVLLGFHVEYQFARDAFLRIAEAARTYGNVVIHVKPPYEAFEPAINGLQAHAVIAAPNTDSELQEVLALRHIARVSIANHMATHALLPVVGNDDRIVGQLAAQHLVEAGFKHFGYFANTGDPYFLSRQDSFVNAAREFGYHCHLGPTPNKNERISLDRVADWLVSLPKPLAVFCPYDAYARDIVNACGLVGLRVPDSVSVMGVDNDPLICFSTSPPLASIATAAGEIGQRALDLALSMVRGVAPPPHPILVPPTGLVVRESCGERAIEDEDVAGAVNFIGRNLRERLTVSRLAEAVAVSERTLQRKFEQVLGRSPNDEIRRARIAHAKRLLTDTELPLLEIARRSGMIRVQRLATMIKVDTGLTPLQFRRRHAK